MCTALTFKTRDCYFGRTLDVERRYHETITVTPRRFPLRFRRKETLRHHYALIGMATVAEGVPLYYEAANEQGLAMAGLNFPGHARYFPMAADRDNITPFELIPWLLGQCRDLGEARALLDRLNLLDLPFCASLPLTPLHWLLADREGAVTVECTVHGLTVADNPVGVLTNSPPFDYHLTRLNEFQNLTASEPTDRFGGPPLTPFSLGMGAIGLPGFLPSSSILGRYI